MIARPQDRLDLSPRFTEADVAALNARFADAGTDELLRAVLVEQVAGRVAVVSSFGAESAVLLDLVAQVDPATPVLFLDTDKHFPETLAYRDELVAHLGLTGLVVVHPDPAVIAARDAEGERYFWDPDGCCEIRKVEPLKRALAPFDASLTGRKGFQSDIRANVPRFELDQTDALGRLKVNPLIDWPADRIARHMADRALPAHPLVAQGYPSIGCAPCTSPVAPGEDPRSGRWRGWNKTECGIHVPGQSDAMGVDLPKP